MNRINITNPEELNQIESLKNIGFNMYYRSGDTLIGPEFEKAVFGGIENKNGVNYFIAIPNGKTRRADFYKIDKGKIEFFYFGPKISDSEPLKKIKKTLINSLKELKIKEVQD